MNDHIAALIAKTVKELFDVAVTPAVTQPEPQFGDAASNVAMQLTKELQRPPRTIAEQIADKLRKDKHITEVTIAGPGFINIRVDDALLTDVLDAPAGLQAYKNQEIVAEYSDPNPFKVLHAGHLYTSVVGDAIANLLEHAGARVHRVNFGGDVGLHVGKTLWAIVRELGGEYPEKLAEVPAESRSEWMAKCYVKGTQAYEDDSTAKAHIIALNKKIYELHTTNDHESPLTQIYWTCRQWSYDYFDAFYARIGSGFEKYYPESETTPLGLEVVKEQLEKGVFERSEGAVVYRGEKEGLHTRVFMTSQGLSTYEAKDLGLALAKWRDYSFDKSIIITGNDITDYMKVVLAAMQHFAPDIPSRTTHLTHGNVKLAGGVKMSSRKGNFLRAVDVLNAASEANKTANGTIDERVSLGAVKYAFLKQRTGPDIIFDPADSVSLHGNSGPYLQYAYARARSILAKKDGVSKKALTKVNFNEYERTLALKLAEYPEVLQRATVELLPYLICTYLYELAQTFNRFYEHSRVLDDPREALRLQLVLRYADTLRDGLKLLGISAPERL